ncbi:hypothetical protein Y032_0310g2102 [Ancylostoma ceylanicum]|uniref:Uncharacterized protein n=1 Tax=Ancylostoma ceylanicum TaxID=53326 RepID=A0A016S3E7_9BILA|nr:hypothetical protein Y032_0310g2102 [Ancylostoma ceylanicum]
MSKIILRKCAPLSELIERKLGPAPRLRPVAPPKSGIENRGDAEGFREEYVDKEVVEVISEDCIRVIFACNKYIFMKRVVSSMCTEINSSALTDCGSCFTRTGYEASYEQPTCHKLDDVEQ